MPIRLRLTGTDAIVKIARVGNFDANAVVRVTNLVRGISKAR